MVSCFQNIVSAFHIGEVSLICYGGLFSRITTMEAPVGAIARGRNSLRVDEKKLWLSASRRQHVQYDSAVDTKLAWNKSCHQRSSNLERSDVRGTKIRRWAHRLIHSVTVTLSHRGVHIVLNGLDTNLSSTPALWKQLFLFFNLSNVVQLPWFCERGTGIEIIPGTGGSSN